MPRKAFVVWNEDKTEGFVTTDRGLSYETRKSASTNCVTSDGTPSPVAVAFCEQWWMDNCTIEEIETEDHIATHEEAQELQNRRIDQRRQAAVGFSELPDDPAENELNLGEARNTEYIEKDPEPERDPKPVPKWWQHTGGYRT